MRAKVLRSCMWAIDPPHPGEITITEGETRDDIPDHIVEQMLSSETDYIKIVKTAKEFKAELLELVRGKEKSEAKHRLKKAGRMIGYKVNKQKSIDNIINDLVTEYKRQNG